MEDVNEKKYHGFIVLPRQLKHLRKELGTNLYHFYIDLAMEARWNRKYKKTLGKIMMTQSELAVELGIDQGTVSKKLDALQSKNCIVKNKKSISLSFMPIFLYDIAVEIKLNDYANWQEVLEDMNINNAELQEKYDKRNNIRTQNTSLRVNTSSNASTSLSESDDYIDNDEVDRGIERMKREKELEIQK